MPLADAVVQDLTFAELLFVLLIGWVLVSLWQRFLDNLAFNTLGLDEDSTYQTFIIALVATTIFLLFIFSFNNIYGGLVESTITGGAVTGIMGTAVTPFDFMSDNGRDQTFNLPFIDKHLYNKSYDGYFHITN